jgi:hypothetical protein
MLGQDLLDSEMSKSCRDIIRRANEVRFPKPTKSSTRNVELLKHNTFLLGQNWLDREMSKSCRKHHLSRE